MDKTRRGFLKLFAAAVPVGALIATAKPATAVSDIPLVSTGAESISFPISPEAITVTSKTVIENQFFSFNVPPHIWQMEIVDGRILHLYAAFTIEESYKREFENELPTYRTESSRASRLIHLKQTGSVLKKTGFDPFGRLWFVAFEWPEL